jgi:predicted RNA methylase
MEQRHLNHKDTVNLGSYYTPTWLVEMVYSLIEKNVPDAQDYYILDTSCGYGGFLRGSKSIGADIDKKAVETARTAGSASTFFNHNSLFEISRARYGLDKNAKVIIVGNPPYNDTTSIIHNSIKEAGFLRDADVLSRDLGISFLLSYNKLAADFVCVLHPLSYLIKKANFEALRQFKNNYALIDSVVVSSGVFSATSKTTCFPVIIALYERNLFGMEYEYILNYKFKTNDNKTFFMKEYDTIGKYVSKYPNHKQVGERETVAYFYTMRDINALKRGATFIPQENYSAVRITKEKLPYYCYVDVFKEYIPHVPYYFGNSDVMIHNNDFSELKELFVSRSIQKHPDLAGAAGAATDVKKYNDAGIELNNYFRRLLKDHYVD